MDIIALNQLISQDLIILQEQITFHEKRAEALKSTEWRSKLHLHTAEKLRSMSEHILQLQSELAIALNQPKPIKAGSQLSLGLNDIQGLPDELVQELSIDTDRIEFTISGLIEEAGGILSLDKILIGIYKKTGEVHKRTAINNRLYRMEKAGDVFKVPGKKSAYSTRQLSPEEIDQIVNPQPLHIQKVEGAR